MDWISDTFIEFVSTEDNPLGLAVLALSAMVEYVFPPFPGDTITLFGAVLITAYGWSFLGVFGAVMAGSVAGSMIDFWFGGWLQRRRLARASAGKASERSHRIDELVVKFERHGAWYLVLNRFLPGIRALFFVAAGMAGLRPVAVLFYSAVSAALWNLGLIALGAGLGANFETLKLWVERYTLITYLVIAALVVFFVVRAVLRRRRGGG